MKNKVWLIVVLFLLLIIVGGLAYKSKEDSSEHGNSGDSGINSEQNDSQSTVDGVGITLNEYSLIF